ncbi:hypothetical protein J6590_037138 [Homalodisca vitripennis]|nr:hypothetical protein J6590_037138 [Homalodisca vitripennis]
MFSNRTNKSYKYHGSCIDHVFPKVASKEETEWYAGRAVGSADTEPAAYRIDFSTIQYNPDKSAPVNPEYLMGLYDSECVTHGIRRPSGGHLIASFLPDANESDAEEADGDIEDPVMSHRNAVTKLNELMVYFERQAETSPAELLMLKRLRDRTARTRQTTLAQP